VGYYLKGIKGLLMKHDFGRIFCILMFILDVLAAGAFAYQGEYRKAIYWFAAGVIAATFI